MSPILIAHIGAGSLAILSGAAALTVRKGSRWHRVLGTLFVISMLTVAALAIYLALFVPPVAQGGAPPQASATVGFLTLYLVATAWMSVRRAPGRIGLFEKLACLAAVGAAAALALFGIAGARAHEALVAPYFVFAGFAVFAAALDLKVIVSGGLTGTARIARHLWRMCFALFFATSFFFIGQQKVMPAALHRSPFLLALGLAPLVVMIFWLVRVRVKPVVERVP